MFNPFPLFIGLRYTGSRRRNQLVSFISGISIAGLVLGVGLLIVVLSVMNGFERELRERILGIVPQAAVYHREGVADWEALRRQVLAQPAIVDAAPFVQLQGMVAHRRKATPVLLYGVDPVREAAISVVENYLDPGLLSRLESDGGVILGAGVAAELSAGIDQRVNLFVPAFGGQSRTPKVLALPVLGILESGTELDNSLALVSLATASQLSSFPGRVSGLRLRVDNLFQAAVTIRDLVRSLPAGYYGSDWTRTHGNLYHAIQISKNLVGLLLLLIIAIAAFNVVSTLVMVVVDKHGDIAILRTLGASSGEIMAVFMVQGSLIGLVGTVLGVAVGLGLSLCVQDLVAWLEQVLSIQFLKSDVYPISYLPAEIRAADSVLVAVTALSMSFIATLYPAWRASKVNPAESLRYE
ncbi:lipoprotein-releasing ABC transporter permease subunit [Exilibacterium tricleocarpae]|uniref:Lipoprotein-releasing ABC transporter permease subunit n=1 Tax=Exilibacterium tricleocarpae TaxID=2591008 RepID=A0A545TVT6_9GAMM|nr:lipoprotein-releasing ABC transporter permease subunit [Exilibacterium tricleocarpae]TQV81337.1 lipoprotein-releasing ABC transporter permease subunit [Exilibacterium tricleocarpae]